MDGKRIKIVNLINLILSAVALILECLPKSVIKAIGPLTGPDHYKTSYHSYFANPSIWNVTLFFAFIIAILTIVCIIINVVVMIKKNKAIYVTSVVFSSVTFVLSTWLADGRHVTIYNILIMAIFLIQTTSKIVVKLSKHNQVTDKRFELLNITSVSVLAVALFFELIPRSVSIVNKYNYNHVAGISDAGYSYFNAVGDNRLFDIAFVVAILSICAFVLDFISIAKNKKWLSIIILSISSVCALSSVVILIMSGRSLTLSNAIVMIAFLVLTASQIIKLELSYDDNKELKKPTQMILGVLSVLALIGSAVAQYFIEGACAIILSTLLIIGYIIYVGKINGDNAVANKKIAAQNWFALIIAAALILFETVRAAITYDVVIEEFPYFTQIEIYHTSYIEYTAYWIDMLKAPIVISTLLILVFDIVALFKDKKAFCITALVSGSVASACNIAIIICYWKYLTAYTIIIMILLLIQVVTLSVKLKMGDWSKKIITEQSGDASI
ncbi:MAG: hypothetical protein K2M75_00030 [Clostridia bacterium]|nr:hypothetical protein [Clostridia bacterium]